MRRPMRPTRRLGDLGLLSPADIQVYAANAGFSGQDLATAVAIALAESFPSGNPNSYNPETKAAGGTPPGQGSYGLWQIYLKKHPEFAGANLYDPQINANAAFSIYSRRGGFSDWSTYTSGAYQSYLSTVPDFSNAGFASTNPAPRPLTIDANTGAPIDDSTPTPLLTPAQANLLSAASSNPLYAAVALGVGAAILWDVLS